MLTIIGGALLAAVTAVLVASAWDGPGKIAFVVTTAVFSLVMTVAPLRHRVRPRALVALPSLAGLGMLLSVLVEVVATVANLQLGPLRIPELFLFGAYSCLAVWLVLVARRTLPRSARLSYLDAVATALGVMLTLWTVALGARAGGEGLIGALVIAAYPTIDIVLVALLVHVAVDIPRMAPSLKWLLGAATLLLALDLTNATYTLLTDSPSATLFSGQVFVSLGFAAAAAHPTLPDIWRHQSRGTTRTDDHARPALLLLTLTPVPVAAVLPATSALDAVIRGLLVTFLFAALTVRVWSTMAALAAAEAHSHHLAMHDPLTGLPNRAALLVGLEERLRRDTDTGSHTAVLFLDVDRFKEVNDSFGHDAGDDLLRHISTRLRRTLRPDDLLARQGGDEFVVVATVADPDDAAHIGERLVTCLKDPILLADGRRQPVTVSVGIAVARPDEPTTPPDLLTRADRTMYGAKQTGRGRWVLQA